MTKKYPLPTYKNDAREAAKIVLFLVDSPLRPLGSPLGLEDKRTLFSLIFCLKIAGNGFIIFSPQFLAILFLGKYFKKSVKDCEISDRQLD